jgi:phosphoesterase RecJ-like protein
LLPKAFWVGRIASILNIRQFMTVSKDEVSIFKQSVLGANRILVVSHKNPDGDTLGSGLALYFVLKSLGKEVGLLCVHPAPEYLSFLPGAQLYSTNHDPDSFDLIICVDIADKKIAGLEELYPRLWDGSLKHKIMDIDHHPGNSEFGFLNIVRTDVAAATVVLYDLFIACGFEISPDAATCLLTGLYTDTGSFMHQNTDAYALGVAGNLLRYGADLKSISKNVFRTTHLKTMKLWGKVFTRTRVNEEGVAVSALTESDYAECGAKREDVAGVVDYLKYIPGVKYASLLTEDQGNIKASLRTIHEDVNVQEIAQQFGGGGHTKASGFMVPGRLQREEVWKIVS